MNFMPLDVWYYVRNRDLAAGVKLGFLAPFACLFPPGMISSVAMACDATLLSVPGLIIESLAA